ncbi:MAG: hypothetical protein E7570_02210 [Ruminococcaceae bacterium]|nr:hypothetical protein [Oscillospiraceae bacterium]
MKIFITTIPPMQKPEFLTDSIYIAANNEKLDTDICTCFPVLPLVKGYSKKGEKVELIVVFTDDDACPNCKVHYAKFLEHAKKYLSDIDYSIKEIKITYDETVEAHLNTFMRIIEEINEGDTVFADISYGTKPLPIIEIMALNYCLRIKKNTVVECLAYGSKDFNTNEIKIYDVTSLLYMDEIINNVGQADIDNPTEFLKSLM